MTDNKSVYPLSGEMLIWLKFAISSYYRGIGLTINECERYSGNVINNICVPQGGGEMKCPYYQQPPIMNRFQECACDGIIPSPWIDVREKLPDEDGKYIVFTQEGGVCVYHFYVGDYDNCGWYSSYIYQARDVKFWQPLPLPPKPEGE